MERLYGVKGDNYDYFFLTEEELEIVKRNCSEFLEGERLLKKIGRRLVRNDGDLFFSLRRKDAELLARIMNGDGTLRRKDDWEALKDVRVPVKYISGMLLLTVAIIMAYMKAGGVSILQSDLWSFVFVTLVAFGGMLKTSAAWEEGYRTVAMMNGMLPVLLMLAWFC